MVKSTMLEFAKGPQLDDPCGCCMYVDYPARADRCIAARSGYPVRTCSI